MMENKIQVGEYVRTIDGIIDKVDRYSFGSCVYHCKNGMCIDECETVGIPISNIKTHSFNIMDLIEEGDILKLKEKNTIIWLGIEKEDAQLNHKEIMHSIKNKEVELLSIVTKEQFKSVEYEV